MKGTVIKRGGKWSVVVDLGIDPTTRKRIRKWHSGYATKKEAERARVELLHNVASGQYVEPTKETLGAFLERWLRDYVATNVAPSAARRYAGIVRRQIIPQLGQIPLPHLRASHIVAAQRHWLTAGGPAPPPPRGAPPPPRNPVHPP